MGRARWQRHERRLLRQLKNHGFVYAYLDDARSRPLIVNAALATANGLTWPHALAGSNPLTVTMTWGDRPDVDLHVYAPDGTRIYNAAPMGVSGYLDYDDVTSWAPRTY